MDVLSQSEHMPGTSKSHNGPQHREQQQHWKYPGWGCGLWPLVIDTVEHLGYDAT